MKGFTVREKKEMREKQGYWDGKNSKSLLLRIHDNWPSGPHFDPIYETGYWKGYNEENI